MPFVSKQQEKWAFATGQPFAKQWAGMTNQKALPQHVSNKTRLARKLAQQKGK